jgi:CRISPR/Cas system-associated protein Csx1
MKLASVNEIKEELSHLSQKELLACCMRLIKFKKDNKELMNYLLFQSNNQELYLQQIKEEISELFKGINSTNLYFAKKSLRKILRITDKYIKHTSSGQVEIELLVHYCITLQSSGIPFERSTALNNLYQAQVKKIEKALSTLHEDLQYDYSKLVQQLHM